MKLSSFVVFFLFFFLLFVVSAHSTVDGAWSPRVRQLLADLDLADKVGQMTQLTVSVVVQNTGEGGQFEVNEEVAHELAATHRIGSLFGGISAVGKNLNVTEWIRIMTELQEIFVSEGSQIPLIYGLDSVHGTNFLYGATIFPQQLGAGAAFNRELTRRMGEITAKDTRVLGVPWVFAPILDLAHNPRWPRVYETFGEDPYLASQLGMELVKGYQGYPRALSDPSKVACTMKHFVGYGNSRSGIDRTPTWIPDTYMYDYYLPPFEAAVSAGIASAMSGYHDVNGEPMISSTKFAQTILREEMGFSGVLVSDFATVKDLVRFHHVAKDDVEAVKMCVERTSTDISMVASDASFAEILLSLVEDGVIPESRVDESVGRILSLKEELGLLDNPFPDPDNPLIETVGSQEDRDVALQLARESLVLVENNILPLDPQQSQNILLIGPIADSLSLLCGGWTVRWQGALSDDHFAFGTTILEGFQEVAPAAEIVHRRGCSILGDFEDGELEEAVELAQEADVVVLVLGERHYAERFGDVFDATLVQGQIELARSLIATGTPVVLVVIEGRQRVIPSDVYDAAAAVVFGFLPCIEGGKAVADVIFGLENPSGRLPVSIPATTGYTPIEYFHKPSQRLSNFAFEFGDGLSYSRFLYSDISLSSDTLEDNQTLTVSVNVTNTGPYPGKETVLMFVRDLVRELVPESKLLKGFEKVSLNVDETAQVNFHLTLDDLQYYGLENRRVHPDGDMEVYIARQTASFVAIPSDSESSVTSTNTRHRDTMTS